MLISTIHPKLLSIVEDIIDKETKKDGFFVPDKTKIQILVDPKITKYKRSSNCPDNRFFQWLSDDELENPPSWAVFFGLVEKVPQFIFENTRTSVVYTPQEKR